MNGSAKAQEEESARVMEEAERHTERVTWDIRTRRPAVAFSKKCNAHTNTHKRTRRRVGADVLHRVSLFKT
jgi:hypothetical protein